MFPTSAVNARHLNSRSPGLSHGSPESDDARASGAGDTSRMGAETTNGDGFGLGWLFASAEAE
jgi:hypothetical protein